MSYGIGNRYKRAQEFEQNWKPHNRRNDTFVAFCHAGTVAGFIVLAVLATTMVCYWGLR